MQNQFYRQNLPKVIILMGAGFVFFFGIILLSMSFGVLNNLLNSDVGIFFMRLVRWGGVEPNAEHYEAMICIIYVVWGVFLLKIAKHPEQNIAFLDFTLFANIAHFGLMTGMAFLMPNEKIHLIGDLLLGWSVLILFMIFWFKSREYYIKNEI